MECEECEKDPAQEEKKPLNSSPRYSELLLIISLMQTVPHLLNRPIQFNLSKLLYSTQPHIHSFTLPTWMGG